MGKCSFSYLTSVEKLLKRQHGVKAFFSLTREPTYDAEFQHFLRGKEIVLNTASLPKINGLTVEQTEAMMRLSCLPAFKDLVSKVQADEVGVGWVFFCVKLLG